MKEDKNKKTVETISTIIALVGGGCFIYWMLTLGGIV